MKKALYSVPELKGGTFEGMWFKKMMCSLNEAEAKLPALPHPDMEWQLQLNNQTEYNEETDSYDITYTWKAGWKLGTIYNPIVTWED